jgi:hypothetical protein
VTVYAYWHLSVNAKKELRIVNDIERGYVIIKDGRVDRGQSARRLKNPKKKGMNVRGWDV